MPEPDVGALTPSERQRVMSLLLDKQPPGTWQLKAVAIEPGAVVVVERARIYIPWPLDVGRAIDLHTGQVHTATIKPSELPDSRKYWHTFHLST